MKILALDSATDIASCAIMENENLLGEITINCKRQHSVILLPLIDTLLRELNIKISELDGFVVAKGPGSFTGLRIGVACVKGLAQGSNKPFVAVSSLDSLAYNMAYTEGIICPILDALRGNVYTALYEFIDHKLTKTTDYMILSIEELSEMLISKQKVVHFIGDGLLKNRDELLSRNSSWFTAPPSLNLIKASSACEIGKELLLAGIHENLYDFVPIYLRKCSAERELERKKGLTFD